MIEYNKEQVLAIKVGRELDYLVAVHVMHLCVLDTLQMYGDGCVMSDKGMDEWLKHSEYGKTEDPNALEPYSTNISTAWEVLSKFPIVMIERVEVFVGNVTVNVSIYADTENGKVFTISSKTLAESSCKAALLAVMDS